MDALSRALVADEAGLRALLDHLPVAVGVAAPVQADGTVRPDARILYYNREWVRLFGFSAQEVRTVAEATARLYPEPALREDMLRRRREAANRRQVDGGSEHMEARAMGAGGRWIEVVTGTAVLGGRMLVTMLDISGQRRAEAALAEALRVELHRAGSARRLIPRPAILAVLADGKYTRVLSGAEDIPDHRAIAGWESLLGADGFVRLDRSTLLHPGRVASISLHGRGARVTLIGSSLQVEVGRAGRERLEQAMRSPGP